MSQSETEDAACQHAMEAAFEKGMSFCQSPEERMNVLGDIVGLDGDDIDKDDALEAGPGTGASDEQTREWVVSRADELIEADGEEPLDAINQAWRDVSVNLDPDEDAAEDGGVEEDEDGDGAEDPLESAADEDVVGGGPDEDED